MGHDGPVNDFLVTYLDSMDERLLEYLDEDDELKLDVVQLLSFYTIALLEGSVTPEHIEEDWPDWYHLRESHRGRPGLPQKNTHPSQHAALGKDGTR